MSVLLVLGAGRANLKLCQTAFEMQVDVCLVSKEFGGYPSEKYAKHKILADITKPNEVLEKISSITIDGILTTCSDRPLPTQAKIVEKYDLPGLNSETALACQNKYWLKERLRANNVQITDYDYCENFVQICRAVEKRGSKAVIKPVASQGSQGVRIVKTEKEFENLKSIINEENNSLEQLETETVSKYSRGWIVEDYLEKPFEFGAQAFIDEGEIKIFAPHTDCLLSSKHPIPVSHFFPFEDYFQDPAFPDKNKLWSQCHTESEKAISALGIKNGAVNLDFIYSNNQLYVLELSNRVGANGLAESLSKHLGINYFELLIKNALGEDCTDILARISVPKKPSFSYMVYPPLGKKVSDFNCTVPNATVEKEKFITEQVEKKKINSSNDCIGQLIVTSENTSNLLAAYQHIKENLQYQG